MAREEETSRGRSRPELALAGWAFSAAALALALVACAGTAWTPSRVQELASRGPCACGSPELDGQVVRIAAAATVEEARALALAPTRQAERALARVRWLHPLEPSLESAHAELVAYRSSVETASSPAEVASHLRALTTPPADDDWPCDYSVGEVVAILLGFLLGILPGLILLILLC